MRFLFTMSDIERLRDDRGQACPNVGLLGLPLRPGASSARAKLMNRIGRKGRKTLKGTEAFLAATPIRSPLSDLRPPNGGARRDRTDDLMLAKHALSQLSYGPVGGRRTDIGRRTMPVVRLPSSVVSEPGGPGRT